MVQRTEAQLKHGVANYFLNTCVLRLLRPSPLLRLDSVILVLLLVPLTTEAESPTPAALGVGVDEFRMSAKDEAAAVDDDVQTSV